MLSIIKSCALNAFGGQKNGRAEHNAAGAAAGGRTIRILRIRREKLAALQQAGRNPFEETVYDVNAYAKDINEKFDEYEGKHVSVAGRILSKRGMGKAGFIDIQDQSGRIQC